MNSARVTSFIEAYATSLVTAIKKRPHNYTLKPYDTPEDYALRVALHTAGLIEQSGLQFLQTESDGFRRACKALGIEHSEDAIQVYLEC